jgi:hypothetical protein
MTIDPCRVVTATITIAMFNLVALLTVSPRATGSELLPKCGITSTFLSGTVLLHFCETAHCGTVLLQYCDRHRST